MKQMILPLLILSFVVVGCGGGASETKPIADCQSEAKAMDTSKLEATVRSYKETIATKVAEMDKLKEKLPGIVDSLKDAVKGTAPDVDVEGLKKEIGALKTSIQNLTQRMEIYVTEAAKKAKAATKQ